MVVISTVTSGLVSANQVGLPSYWRTNLGSPVRFNEAIQIIMARGSYHLVELGLHLALQLPINQYASKLE